MKSTYTIPIRTQFSATQAKQLEAKRKEWGYPDVAKLVRRLVMEGLKGDFPYRLPE